MKRGEFVCIYGTSGGGRKSLTSHIFTISHRSPGKTTLLNIIGTIDKPTKGEMFICGKRITSETSDKVRLPEASQLPFFPSNQEIRT